MRKRRPRGSETFPRDTSAAEFGRLDLAAALTLSPSEKLAALGSKKPGQPASRAIASTGLVKVTGLGPGVTPMGSRPPVHSVACANLGRCRNTRNTYACNILPNTKGLAGVCPDSLQPGLWWWWWWGVPQLSWVGIQRNTPGALLSWTSYQETWQLLLSTLCN